MAVSFTFTVGSHERHEVTVEKRGARNRVRISVDGVAVVDSGGNLGSLMPNVFDVEVGHEERHMVSVRFISQQLIDGGSRYVDVFIDARFAFRHG